MDACRLWAQRECQLGRLLAHSDPGSVARLKLGFDHTAAVVLPWNTGMIGLLLLLVVLFCGAWTFIALVKSEALGIVLRGATRCRRCSTYLDID